MTTTLKKLICDVCKHKADSDDDEDSIKETGACMFCYREHQEAVHPEHPDGGYR